MDLRGQMTRRSFAPLCALLLFALPISVRPQSAASPAAKETSPPLTAGSFAQQLRDFQSSLRATPETAPDIVAFVRALPAGWNVSTPDGDFRVSSAPLRDLLASAASDPSTRTVKIQQAQRWLAELETEVAADDASGGLPDARARAQLTSILSRSEYNHVQKTSVTDWLRQKIWNWLTRLFESLSIRATRHPLGERIFFWLLLLGLVTWLAFALFRFWSQRSRFEDLKPPRTFARTRTWQEWLRSAREAAGRGDFREAVHSAYWGAIAHLEDLELVPADRTRTPREYVRLYSAPREQPPSPSDGQKKSLATVTSRLERTWYGRAPASPADFQDTLREVEVLGCQLP